MQPFITKLGIVVHHHEPECHVKNWDSIFKVKVTENMTISTIPYISSKPVSLFATKLNLMVDHHKQRSVQWICWIAVFKVNVTAKVKSFS